MKYEIHLFVLWDKVGPSKEDILRQIGKEFEILRVFRIRWSPSLFSSNLSRFYGQNLPVGCNKETSCGSGPFTLVVVRDIRPDYAMRRTTKGEALVNTRTFDLKAFLRSPAGGSFPVHATDTKREVAHDIILLLGVSLSHFEMTYPGQWDGNVIFLRQDIIGARGWKSIGDLFAVFNETLDYVVLRNFECLPNSFHLESHGDIDLLVDSFIDACAIANAAPVFPESYRVYRTVSIAGEAIPFDFRYVGDNYFDEVWQRQVLSSRTLTVGNFYVPDQENYFYNLLYHAAVHKPSIASDYAARLVSLAESIGIQIDPKEFFPNPKKVRAFLANYLKRHGFRFTRPVDPTVHFNTAIALGPFGRIRHRFLPTKTIPVKPLQPLLKGHAQLPNIEDERLTGYARANLLRPFQVGVGQRVLELGCEGGVITRYLGESGADVVAVEGSLTLASVAENNCQHLPNVRIICDDPTTAEVDGSFDIVILIGTHEYVTNGKEEDNALDVLLKRAAAALNENGFLIFAASNQLGLKYFNGCTDGCTPLPYLGLNNLYEPGEPVTYGRHVLTKKLEIAGFLKHEFFYPFPDYKLPGLILSDAALTDSRLNVADLLIHSTGRNYPETQHRAFAEDLVWQVVAENRLISQLSNSFLITARLQDSTTSPVPWLAKIYSRGQRHPRYRVESTIDACQTSGLMVHKHHLWPQVHGTDNWLDHVITDSDYISGQLLIGKIHKAMALHTGIDGMSACFSPWLVFLRTHASLNKKNELVLPGNFVDCIPANMITVANGALHYFDAEWISKEPIPLSWIVIRGITYSLIDCMENVALKQMTYRKFIDSVAERAFVNLSEIDYTVADSWEAKLVEQCHMDGVKTPRLSTIYDSSLFLIFSLAGNVTDLRHRLVWHEAELVRIKSTISWRVTIPLRVGWNAFRRLFRW